MLAQKQEEVEKSFSKRFATLLYEQKQKKNHDQLIFLCLGTDRMTGDCFGPLVGQKLQEHFSKRYLYRTTVMGTLEETLPFEEVAKAYQVAKKEHPKACFIAVDAALGKKEQIGKVFLSDQGISIGKGLKKPETIVGDIGIKAVVGRNTKLANHNFQLLQSIPLHFVMKLADEVAGGIFDVIQFE